MTYSTFMARQSPSYKRRYPRHYLATVERGDRRATNVASCGARGVRKVTKIDHLVTCPDCIAVRAGVP